MKNTDQQKVKKLRIVITGATGFVGEGVLLQCLQHPHVEAVLMINRKPFNQVHAKLKEIIVPDFMRAEQYAEELKSYDTCFYCAGKSSLGMNEVAYTKITYDATLAFTGALLRYNEGATFCFVSGSHTDSTGKGKIMWARVKGKTENALSKLPFKNVYHFRPGGMIPTRGQQNSKTGYSVVVKLLALIMPKRVSTLKDVGLAMINAALFGSAKQVLEISDINELAANSRIGFIA